MGSMPEAAGDSNAFHLQAERVGPEIFDDDYFARL
jgi:hypothetical protein